MQNISLIIYQLLHFQRLVIAVIIDLLSAGIIVIQSLKGKNNFELTLANSLKGVNKIFDIYHSDDSQRSAQAKLF